MLSFFRNNLFTTAIPLGIYVVLTHLAALMGYVQPVVHDYNGGGLLYDALFGWAPEHPFYSALAATVLVFLQALMINNLADTFRLLGERNWLPGLFFALVAVSSTDFLFISPPLVAATFVPLSLRKIFSVYKTPQATALIFDAALWMSLGCFFYPSAILLMLAAYAGINIMRSFNIREQLVFLSGGFVTFILLWVVFFWYDKGTLLIKGQFYGLFGWTGFFIPQDMKSAVTMGLAALLFLTILLGFGTYYFRKLIQTQKCITTLYWFFFTGLVSTFLRPELSYAHFFLIMPVVGIFLSMSIQAIRRRIFAELFHLAILSVALFIQYFPF